MSLQFELKEMDFVFHEVLTFNEIFNRQYSHFKDNVLGFLGSSSVISDMETLFPIIKYKVHSIQEFQ